MAFYAAPNFSLEKKYFGKWSDTTRKSERKQKKKKGEDEGNLPFFVIEQPSMHVMYNQWKLVICRDKMVKQWCSKGNPYGLRHCSLNRSKNLVAVSLDLEGTRENNMALRTRRALAIERPGAIHRTSHPRNKPKRQTACFLLISFYYSSFLTFKFGEIFISELFFTRRY